MTTIQEQLNNIEKQKKDLEEKIMECKENERINNLKINGYSKLKDFNIDADKYIKSTGSKTQFKGVYELRQTIFHTTPRFELIYDLFLIQQEKINFLEERIKQLENSK